MTSHAFNEADHPRTREGRFTDKPEAPEYNDRLALVPNDPDPWDDEPEDQDDPALVEAPRDFTFPAWKLDAAIASIEKANRRAERAGIPERFGWSTTTHERRFTDDDGNECVEDMVTLALDRPTVQHDGWSFTATLTWDDEAGLVTRTVPGATLETRPDDRACDVCGQRRDRKDTYVVQRTTDDGTVEQMQVGSDCLQRFMGIRPAGLWMLEYDIDVDDTPPPRSHESYGPPMRYDSGYVLSLGLAAAERDGWVSRSAASAYNAAGGHKTATADTVGYVLHGKPQTEQERRAIEQLKARAAELRSDADGLLAEARDFDGDSDYAVNMRAVAGADSVSGRNMSLLLSAIAARQARVDREVRNQATAHSQHVGTVGDKLTDVKVTVDQVRHIEGTYGVTSLVSMRDEHGNVFKWFASGAKQFDAGATFTMKATIKDHDEYQGVKQTMVTRAKLEPEAAP